MRYCRTCDYAEPTTSAVCPKCGAALSTMPLVALAPVVDKTLVHQWTPEELDALEKSVYESMSAAPVAPREDNLITPELGSFRHRRTDPLIPRQLPNVRIDWEPLQQSPKASVSVVQEMREGELAATELDVEPLASFQDDYQATDTNVPSEDGEPKTQNLPNSTVASLGHRRATPHETITGRSALEGLLPELPLHTEELATLLGPPPRTLIAVFNYIARVREFRRQRALISGTLHNRRQILSNEADKIALNSGRLIWGTGTVDDPDLLAKMSRIADLQHTIEATKRTAERLSADWDIDHQKLVAAIGNDSVVPSAHPSQTEQLERELVQRKAAFEATYSALCEDLRSVELERTTLQEGVAEPLRRLGAHALETGSARTLLADWQRVQSCLQFDDELVQQLARVESTVDSRSLNIGRWVKNACIGGGIITTIIGVVLWLVG